jgi:dTDP-4-amino-4,6-dideoxygalactose transaminase
MPAGALERLAAVLESGRLAGDGPVCREVENSLERALDRRHALLTTSCSHALELAMTLVANDEPGEVILPSFTFSATANAVLRAGLDVVFAEIDPRTMNLDPADVARRVTPRTRAIIPVHYAGVGCQMDALAEIAGDRIAIVEDAAHAIGARWRGRPLGSIGVMGCLSFHESKNLVCGEGGALLTDDDALAERAEIIREKGTNRLQMFRGQVDKYTWVDVGSSYVLAELLAALLAVQLEAFPEMQCHRREQYFRYQEGLADLAAAGRLELPAVPDDCESNFHLYHVLLPSLEHRDGLMRHLRQRGIGAAFHYIPLHSAPVGQRLGWQSADLPITEAYAQRLLRLPLYPDLQPYEQEEVMGEIQAWAQHA